jgi:hypothetical protein
MRSAKSCDWESTATLESLESLSRMSVINCPVSSSASPLIAHAEF